MTQTRLSQNGSSLLNYAISKLNPDIFSHPVWVHYGKKKTPVPLSIIDDLLCAAKNIQENDPSGACQVLLICVFYQNFIGHRNIARDTARSALTLARRSGLLKEILWITWGACAICYQQGDKEEAASHLDDLQVELLQRDEWMLANFVDVIKHSLCCSVADFLEEHSDIPNQRPITDPLRITFEWLQNWGCFAQFPITQYTANSKYSIRLAIKKINWIRPFFSFRGWQARWNSLICTLKQKRNLFSHGFTKHPMIRNLPLAHTDYPTKISPQYLKPALTNKQVSRETETIINMVVQMLGPFSMTIQDTIIKLPASRGLSLLKYMLLHNKQSITREVLMDIFWPNAEPESARNNLNVTIHSLRKELRSLTDLEIIVYENSTYRLSPKINIWLDVEEFERSIKAGKKMEYLDQKTAAVAEYEIAVNLYQGDFLADNPYDDWTVHERERLRVAFLDTLDHLSYIYFSQGEYGACTMLCQRILTMDNCSENAHRRLMRCYSRQGQHHLALRQYQVCVEAIREELDIAPLPATNELYEQIRRGQKV